MDPAWREGIRVARRLALAHHPLCRYFDADVFGVRIRVCSGCAVAVPALIVGVLAGVWLLTRANAQPWPLAAASLLLGLPQLSTYVHRGSRLYRAMAKAVGGVGLGGFLIAAWLLPIHTAWRLAGFAALAAAFLALQGLRMRAIRRTCQQCPWRADWDQCPGFRSDARWRDPPWVHRT
jgi:hypothetical protein